MFPPCGCPWNPLLFQLEKFSLNPDFGDCALAASMFPFEITPVEKSTNEKLISHFVGEDQYYQIGPKKFLMSSSYPEHAESFYNIDVKDDDVWIVTHPRSGTTWTQEMMWLLTHNLDFEKSKSMRHGDKFFFLERSILVGKGKKERKKEAYKDDEKMMEYIKLMDVPGHEVIKTLESPRCIQTHLPFSILPPNLLNKAKVVYVARNPKDCAVSNYYLKKGGPNGFEGGFEQYWCVFQEGLLLFGPHIEHVKEGWDRRDNPNLLFLFYEDIKKDLPSTIRKMASFLGKDISDDDVNALADHLSFDNMKSVETTLGPQFPFKKEDPTKRYPHFRKGKIGYSEEFKNVGKRADEWVEKQMVETGIPFRTTEKLP